MRWAPFARLTTKRTDGESRRRLPGTHWGELMKKLLIAVAASILCACGSVQAPSDSQYAAADFGAFPSNYEAIVRAYYGQVLKDPDSALYKPSSQPKQYWLGNRFEPAGAYGYLVCATVNGKNSYGGYVGYKTDGFLIRNGTIVRYLKDGEFAAENLCAP
jgi:hypothetical protein